MSEAQNSNDISQESKENKKKKIQTAENANCFSSLLFNWCQPTLRLGKKRPLNFEDLPPLPKADSAQGVKQSFYKAWEVEKKKKKPSLSWALWNAYKTHYIFAGFLKLIHDILQFVSPIALNLLIKFMDDTSKPLYEGIIIACVVFVCSIIQSLCLRHYFYYCYEVGMLIRSAVIATVYDKSLKLSTKSRDKYTTGQINNMMAVDGMKLQGLTGYLQTLWSGPFQIIVSIVMLWMQLGYSCLGGLAVIIIMVPLSAWFANKIKHYQKLIMGTKDERVKSTGEMLNGIKIVKLQTWEESFKEKIHNFRKVELKDYYKKTFYDCISSGLWGATPALVGAATFTLYTAVGYKLTVATAFTSLSLFDILRFPISMLPKVISNVAEARISLQRIEQFLEGEEITEIGKDEGSDVNIKIENATFNWPVTESPAGCVKSPRSPHEGNTLQHINFEAHDKGLIAIVGDVGSGKTSFLCSLLGDIELVEGKVNMNGKVAYSSQVPFIQNASLRDNILFGKEFDEAKYKKVLYNCALVPDLEILPNRDLTEIGEKGINLSGGQRARISLARALYSDSDIYLLDDILSAVDVHVGKHIFKNAIKKGLSNKLVLLVTNAVEYLNEVDDIIVLSKNEIAERGNFDTLMKDNGIFTSFLNALKVNRNNVNKTEDEDERRSAVSLDAISKVEDIKIGNENKNDLITIEERATGQVAWKVYQTYIMSVGGWIVVILILVAFTIGEGVTVGNNLWLSLWSSEMEKPSPLYSTWTFLGVYLGLGFGSVIVMGLRTFYLKIKGLSASQILHDNLLDTVLYLPMSFFDTTPIGRILNRFSKEVDVIDGTLPDTLNSYFQQIFRVLSTIVVIVYATPWFLVAIIPIYFIYRAFQNYYLMSSREIKRLESISSSPIYAHFSETLTGVSTIRAYKDQTRFIKQNEDKVNDNQSAYYMTFSCNSWLGIRLEFTGSIIVLAASILSVIKHGDVDFTKYAALSLSYALSVTQSLNWVVRMTSDRETNIVSVERIDEYIHNEREASPINPLNRPPDAWPENGTIDMKDVVMRYREGLEPVLRNITFQIPALKKIGIVGRTGSGKSSLLLALLRIVESEGEIIIDNVNIKSIGLRDLRRRVAVIPQEPIIFSGTIRANIDPFNEYSDDVIWKVLESCNVKEYVENEGGLDATVLEKGSNLSQGQQQLLCIARAMIRKCKIIVMDEATSSIDIKTDSLIQDTIEREFKNCTVITVAHRINTIINSDKVMTMDSGKLVEYDDPNVLRENPESLFHILLEEFKHNN